MTVIALQTKRNFDQRKGIAKGMTLSEVVSGVAISFMFFTLVLG